MNDQDLLDQIREFMEEEQRLRDAHSAGDTPLDADRTATAARPRGAPRPVLGPAPPAAGARGVRSGPGRGLRTPDGDGREVLAVTRTAAFPRPFPANSAGVPRTTNGRHRFPDRMQRCRGLAALVVTAVVFSACGAAGAETPSPTSEGLVPIGAGLEGPAGSTASVYAEGLTHVAAFAFDTDGRLWVATAAYEDEGDDAVYVVPAAGATPVKVITDVHTPLGLLWYDGALYVSSSERVDAYRDFDGTTLRAVDDRRDVPDRCRREQRGSRCHRTVASSSASRRRAMRAIPSRSTRRRSSRSCRTARDLRVDAREHPRAGRARVRPGNRVTCT